MIIWNIQFDYSFQYLLILISTLEMIVKERTESICLDSG
nr:MAG TPA: hypothetical protein [Caudoviricetes sp.]